MIDPSHPFDEDTGCIGGERWVPGIKSDGYSV